MTQARISLHRLRGKARRTAHRLRCDEAIARVARTLPLPLIYFLAVLTVVKVWRLDGETARRLAWGVVVPGAIVVGAIVYAFFRKRSPHAGSLRLDQHHQLQDRVTNALVFDALPDGERTPLMRAAIEDGVRVADQVSPRRAAPLHFPKDLLVSALLGVAVYGLSMLEVRTTREVPVVVPEFTPMVMSSDDVELFRDTAEQLDAESDDPEVRAAVRRFNQLIEDIAERRVDRREVFKRLEEIERGMLAASDAERAALEEGLGGVARELKQSELAKPVAEALEQKKLADAEQAMRELAETLRNKKKIDKKKLERLREALQRASKEAVSRSQKLEARRQELEEQRKRLLKKKQEKGLSKKEQSELDKLDRQLERLNREKKRAAHAQRQLSDLDRELAEAARKLMEELGASAQDLERGAQDLNRMAQKQLTDKEKEELKRQIEQMRELLRQQGKGGLERMKQLQRFGQKARGGKPGPGEGPQGKGKGKPQLTLQRGSTNGSGVDIPMPGAGSPAPGPGQGDGEQPGDGAQGGNEWGTGHDPNIKGDKSELEGQTQDVAAAGADTGQGPSASEVIYGAADRGFTGRGYRKIFTDYQTVAESVLNQDEIPPGYEFYVRRYFQLIRPRE